MCLHKDCIKNYAECVKNKNIIHIYSYCIYLLVCCWCSLSAFLSPLLPSNHFSVITYTSNDTHPDLVLFCCLANSMLKVTRKDLILALLSATQNP